MSYSIYDSNGYIGDLATGRGLDDLRKHVESHGGELVKRLFEAGHMRIHDALMDEIDSLPSPNDPSIRATLGNFCKLVKKATDIIIISDGTFDAET